MTASPHKTHRFIALFPLFLLLLSLPAMGRSLEKRCQHGDQDACRQLSQRQEPGGNLEDRCQHGDQEACHQLRRMRESGGDLEDRCQRGDQEACSRLRYR